MNPAGVVLIFAMLSVGILSTVASTSAGWRIYVESKGEPQLKP